MQEILNQLNELSYNLYWTWNNDFRSIFAEINRDYWKWSQKNPVKFLSSINNNYLFDILEKKNLKDKIHKVYREYREYLNRNTFYNKSKKKKNERTDERSRRSLSLLYCFLCFFLSWFLSHESNLGILILSPICI